MRSRTAVTVLFAIQLLGSAAFAQSSGTAEEWRGTGGQIDVRAKEGNRLSGTIAVRRSSSDAGESTLESRSSRDLELTAGGALIEDRLWFFGSAQWSEQTLASQFSRDPGTQPLAARATARISDRHLLVSSVAKDQGTGFDLRVPQSFLNLSYTGILSSSSFFTLSVSREKRNQSMLPADPLQR